MFGFNLNKETQKVNKSWNQFTVSSILTKNEQKSLSVKTMLRIVSLDWFFWENCEDHKLLSRFTKL